MSTQEAYALGKSIMMMEFEETAVTGSTVRPSAALTTVPAGIRRNASDKRRAAPSVKLAVAR